MKVKLFLLIFMMISTGCTLPIGGQSGTKLTFAPNVSDLQWWDRATMMSEIENQSLMDHFGMRVSFYLISDERSEYEKNEQRMRWIGELMGAEVESAPVDWLHHHPPK